MHLSINIIQLSAARFAAVYWSGNPVNTGININNTSHVDACRPAFWTYCKASSDVEVAPDKLARFLIIDKPDKKKKRVLQQ